MRLLHCTECGARNADFVVTGCGDETHTSQFSCRQIPRCQWDRQTSGRYMDTVWLLIETDETKQQGRTRTGRPVAMSLAAQLRRAARIGLLAAGLVALLITASGTGQLRAQSFNCRYARHPDERVICHDPLLGR